MLLRSVKPHQRRVIIYFLSFFFIFWFTNWHLLSLFLNSGVTLSSTLSCVSPLTLTQTLQMLLLYGISIITDRLQPPHHLTTFLFFLYKFSIVLSPQIDRYGLQWNSFLSDFFLLFRSWLKSVYQNSIKWVQEIGSDSRACRQKWSRWEKKISSPSPKGINSKWVLLFVLFLLFIYFHLITRKKNVVQFWDFMINKIELLWSKNY